MWYEMPELSKVMKLENLRTAERGVKFDMMIMRELQQHF